MENYSWKSVGDLEPLQGLPDPFLRFDDTRVQKLEEWPEQREYLKSMLRHYMYGELPPTPNHTKGTVLSSEELYEGRAIKEKILIECGFEHKISYVTYLIRPNKPGRYPVIVLNSFSIKGQNPEILRANGIITQDESGMLPCPVEEQAVCERDYCISLVDCTQLATDEHTPRGQLYEAYPDRRWKTIAVWAWCQSRVIDFLEGTPYADMQQIIAAGHSRYGKVALCAAIYDERIALCAAMGSGCGGAGCFRVTGGKEGAGTGYVETLGAVLTIFPHWFSDNLKPFSSADPSKLMNHDGAAAFSKDGKHDPQKFRQFMNENFPLKEEDRLPFDLHTIRALVAPRLLITSDGLDDEWANPYGAKVSWLASKEVYRFLGAEENTEIHFREGGHSFSVEDWIVLLEFADRRLRKI